MIRIAVDMKRDLSLIGGRPKLFHACRQKFAGVYKLVRNCELPVGGIGEIEHRLDLHQKMHAAVMNMARIIGITRNGDRPH